MLIYDQEVIPPTENPNYPSPWVIKTRLYYTEDQGSLPPQRRWYSSRSHVVDSQNKRLPKQVWQSYLNEAFASLPPIEIGSGVCGRGEFLLLTDEDYRKTLMIRESKLSKYDLWI